MFVATLVSLLLAQAAPSPTASAGKCTHEADIASAVVPDTTSVNAQSDLFAIVAVLVAPNGSVENAKIYRSSGNLDFDQASVRAARHSTYKPKLVDCTPVEGTVYYYTSRTGGYPPRPGEKLTPPPWPKDLSPPPG